MKTLENHQQSAHLEDTYNYFHSENSTEICQFCMAPCSSKATFYQHVSTYHQVSQIIYRCIAGVNFIYILCANFSYQSASRNLSLIIVWLVIFWRQEIGKKTAPKMFFFCWWNWLQGWPYFILLMGQILKKNCNASRKQLNRFLAIFSFGPNRGQFKCFPSNLSSKKSGSMYLVNLTQDRIKSLEACSLAISEVWGSLLFKGRWVMYFKGLISSFVIE